MNVSNQIIIGNNEMAKYNELKSKGYKTLWIGEGKICLCK